MQEPGRAWAANAWELRSCEAPACVAAGPAPCRRGCSRVACASRACCRLLSLGAEAGRPEHAQTSRGSLLLLLLAAQAARRRSPAPHPGPPSAANLRLAANLSFPKSKVWQAGSSAGVHTERSGELGLLSAGLPWPVSGSRRLAGSAQSRVFLPQRCPR